MWVQKLNINEKYIGGVFSVRSYGIIRYMKEFLISWAWKYVKITIESVRIQRMCRKVHIDKNNNSK